MTTNIFTSMPMANQSIIPSNGNNLHNHVNQYHHHHHHQLNHRLISSSDQSVTTPTLNSPTLNTAFPFPPPPPPPSPGYLSAMNPHNHPHSHSHHQLSWITNQTSDSKILNQRKSDNNNNELPHSPHLIGSGKNITAKYSDYSMENLNLKTKTTTNNSSSSNSTAEQLKSAFKSITDSTTNNNKEKLLHFSSSLSSPGKQTINNRSPLSSPTTTTTIQKCTNNTVMQSNPGKFLGNKKKYLGNIFSREIYFYYFLIFWF